MKITKIAVLILALVMACGLLSACGGSQADKDYDRWTQDSLPKMEEAKSALESDLAEASANSDIPAVRDALQAFIDVLKPVVSQLEAVGMSKLTDARKTEAPKQLEELKAGLAAYETELQATKDKIEEILQEMEQGEAPDDDGSGDEEYYDEEYDGEYEEE